MVIMGLCWVLARNTFIDSIPVAGNVDPDPPDETTSLIPHGTGTREAHYITNRRPASWTSERLICIVTNMSMKPWMKWRMRRGRGSCFFGGCMICWLRSRICITDIILCRVNHIVHLHPAL
jgi:hypothetical protein